MRRTAQAGIRTGYLLSRFVLNHFNINESFLGESFENLITINKQVAIIHAIAHANFKFRSSSSLYLTKQTERDLILGSPSFILIVEWFLRLGVFFSTDVPPEILLLAVFLLSPSLVVFWASPSLCILGKK